MTLDGIDVVFYTFTYLVPGYIIMEIISTLMPSKKLSEGEKTVRSIAYSVLNLALWRWLFLLIKNLFIEPTLWYWLLNTLAVFLTGGLTGIAIGFVKSKNILHKLLESININAAHPTPTAWDYRFSDGKEYWVEVYISDGKIIRGFYGGNSFTADDDHRDILIEEVYTKEDDDEWKKVERTAGVLICPNEIKYIKFYKVEEKYEY